MINSSPNPFKNPISSKKSNNFENWHQKNSDEIHIKNCFNHYQVKLLSLLVLFICNKSIVIFIFFEDQTSDQKKKTKQKGCVEKRLKCRRSFSRVMWLRLFTFFSVPAQISIKSFQSLLFKKKKRFV